jgi:glycosyltransferase involved in cell wall biosynthesis
VAGRGFDQMLDAADLAAAARSPLLALFVGDGRLSLALRERAATRENVRWLPAMPRADYLELLAACDVGMVATVPGVTSFSVPTKTIDYLRAGLPVIAAVEHGSDFAAIVRRYAIGRVVPFGEPWQFQAEAIRLAARTDRAAIRAAATRCLDEVFDVRHALTAIDRAIAA